MRPKGIANSVDLYQTAPLEEQSDLGLHCFPRPITVFVALLGYLLTGFLEHCPAAYLVHFDFAAEL